MRFPAGCGEPYLLYISDGSAFSADKTEPPLLSQATAVRIEVFLF